MMRRLFLRMPLLCFVFAALFASAVPTPRNDTRGQPPTLKIESVRDIPLSAYVQQAMQIAPPEVRVVVQEATAHVFVREVTLSQQFEKSPDTIRGPPSNGVAYAQTGLITIAKVLGLQPKLTGIESRISTAEGKLSILPTTVSSLFDLNPTALYIAGQGMYSTTNIVPNSGTPATADGTTVRGWQSLTASSTSSVYHLTGGAGGTLKTGLNGINGLPFVRFNSASYQSLKSSAFAATLAQPYSVTILVRVNAFASQAAPNSTSPVFFDGVMQVGDIDSSTRAFLGTNTSGAGWTANAGNALNTQTFDPTWTPDANWHILTLVCNGTDSALYVDGKFFVGNLGAKGIKGITLGADYGNGQACSCDVALFGLFPAALTSTQVNQATKLIAATYGLSAQVKDTLRSLSDNFTRADSSTIGASTSDHIWQETGATALGITSNRLGIPSADANFGYAFPSLPMKPVKFGGTFILDKSANPGASNSQNLTLLSTNDGTLSLGYLGVHAYITATNWGFQVRVGNGDFVTIASGTHAATLDMTGATTYETFIEFDQSDPNTVYWTKPNGLGGSVRTKITDGRIKLWSGKFCGWETSSTSGSAYTFWKSAYASFQFLLLPLGFGVRWGEKNLRLRSSIKRKYRMKV